MTERYFGCNTLKHSKYCSIKENHTFVAFSLETFGPWSPDNKELFKDINKLLLEKSGVSESPSYFQQRMSILLFSYLLSSLRFLIEINLSI
jgi:hypothetical protein